jgi:hypothetical protein
MGPSAARLAHSAVAIRGDTLVMRVPGGRSYAEARRARGTPDVEGLLRSHFPHLRSFDVEIEPGTGTPADQQQALRQLVGNDPQVKRVLERLGGEVESVIPLEERDGES